ncbi:MAG: ATP-binding cassette domain-containing protein [Firmicutes bacterium]|nr:ATP-binding cassette domain-containing protein [Bacillota bacterium]
MKKEKVLEVNNLKISFRTPNGLVRAVRDISFDLYKGETLAIVGESGSGKSVTNRAIMGILAGNGIIDDGSIMYRDQDLAKLSEANFHAIRGNKLGMIFQDPLSSLNPTMKIGKQITEAMLVNGNRIKNKMMDMYHTEYYEYVNKKKELELARKNTKTKIFEVQLNNELSKSDKKSKISELKQELKLQLSAIKVEIPPYKKKFLEKKAEAVEALKVETIKIREDEAKKLKELKNRFADAKKELSKFTKGASEYDAHLAIVKGIRKEILNNKENFKRQLHVTKKEAYECAIEIMNEVGISEPEKRFNQYPFQFSGGMRQRVVIAIALMANPEVLICDEPTTALDVTIQGQILNLIKNLKKQRDLSVIFITHDLGVVANVADRVAVMYAGKIVEYGTSEDVFYNPKHPYTWALLSSVPDLDTKEKLLSIPGTPPDMLYPPVGDAFADRNQFALKIDFEEQPPFFKVSDTHFAASWLLHEDAPKVEMPNIVKLRIEKYKAQEKAFQQSKGAQA